MRARIRPNAGAAMIAVLCALAVFMLMGLALVLSASALTATAMQRHRQEACYQLAKSFSNALRVQLDGQTFKGAFSGAGTDLPAQLAYATEELRNVSDSESTRFFVQDTPQGNEQQYGEVMLGIRMEPDGDETGLNYLVYLTIYVVQGDAQRSYTGVYRRAVVEQVFLGDGSENIAERTYTFTYEYGE